MERKKAPASVRNKERSKQKFLNAVGEILKKEGYTGLKINHIAATAGVDKTMIYSCFGGLEGLLDAYIRSVDFWSNVGIDRVPQEITDGGEALATSLLMAQSKAVFAEKELQKILLWRLSEPRKSLEKMTEQQEKAGELLFQHITDPYFGENAGALRAVMAILVSGLYHLNLYAAVNGSVFCGIDLASESGRAAIDDAVSFLVSQTFKNLKPGVPGTEEQDS